MEVGVTWGYLGSFGVKILKFQNIGKLYTKMKLLVTWLRKSGSRGHLTPNWGYLGSFGVKILKFQNIGK